MLKQQIVLKHDKLVFTLTGVRDRQSGKLTETMTLEYPGFETISVTTKQLDMPVIAFPKHVREMMKRLRQLGGQGLWDMRGFEVRYEYLMRNFKLKMNRGWVENELRPYLEGLKFGYETIDSIRCNSKGVVITLYQASTSSDKLDVRFNYTANRKYITSINLNVRNSDTLVKQLMLTREEFIEKIDYLDKQFLEWLDELQTRSGKDNYRVRNIRSGAKDTYFRIRPYIEEVLIRLNKGIEL